MKSNSDANFTSGSKTSPIISSSSSHYSHYQQQLIQQQQEGHSHFSIKTTKKFKHVRERGSFFSTPLAYRRFTLILGIILGALFPTLLLKPQIPKTLISHASIITNYLSLALPDVDFTTITNLIPDSKFQSLNILTEKFSTDGWLLSGKEETFMPAKKFIEDHPLELKHPVILVPGIISTGLEVWNSPGGGNRSQGIQDKTCATKYFRTRMWGTVNQVTLCIFLLQL